MRVLTALNNLQYHWRERDGKFIYKAGSVYPKFSFCFIENQLIVNACAKDGCYLRIKEKGTAFLPVFRKEDLKLDGDVFYHKKILIHRSEPAKAYLFSQEIRGRQYFKYGKDNLYVYREGMAPVYAGKVKYTCNASSSTLEILDP